MSFNADKYELRNHGLEVNFISGGLLWPYNELERYVLDHFLLIAWWNWTLLEFLRSNDKNFIIYLDVFKVSLVSNKILSRKTNLSGKTKTAGNNIVIVTNFNNKCKYDFEFENIVWSVMSIKLWVFIIKMFILRRRTKYEMVSDIAKWKKPSFVINL